MLAITAAALGGTGLRVANLAAPSGLERLLAAGVLATAVAVVEALALGLVGLGTHPIALPVIAGATWLVAVRALPRPTMPVGPEALDWWRALSPRGRVGFSAVTGIAGASAAWSVRHPILGIDGIQYHLPEVVAWVQNGRPGSVETIHPLMPFGNYPVTNEVILSWEAGIAQSFAPVPIWGVAMLALLGMAGWTGLRTLDVSRVPAALAVAALCATPVVGTLVTQPNTDLPGVAWLVTAAALSAASARRPTLLPFALLAAGLAVGTKTTTAPLAALAIVVAFAANRGRLGTLRAPLIAAAGGTLVIGGLWYLRNLVDHGSPLWPFVALPGGDPVPELWDRIDVSLLNRPVETVSGRLGGYLALLGGSMALLAAGMVAPVAARKRQVLIAAMVSVAALLLWASAPSTGVSDEPGLFAATNPTTTVRYLLPGIAAAVLTVALASRHGRGARTFALVTLGFALGLSLIQGALLGGGFRIPGAVALAGAVLGAAAGCAGSWRGLRWPRPLGRPAVRGGATVALGTLLIAGSSGYLERATGTYSNDGYREVVAFLIAQPEFVGGDRSVAVAPVLLGPLTGERLQHPLELIPADEPCAQIERRSQQQWVVVREDPAFTAVSGYSASKCLFDRRPEYEDGVFRVYGPVQQPP